MVAGGGVTTGAEKVGYEMCIFSEMGGDAEPGSTEEVDGIGERESWARKRLDSLEVMSIRPKANTFDVKI